MEISFESESLQYYERLFSAAYTQEQTTEIIVPDAMPDVAAVLEVDGAALLRGKEAQSGRLIVSGAGDITVLYQPEDGSQVRRLGLEAPFDAACDCPGLTELDRLVATVRLMSVDARILNSRKLLIRAEICITVSAWSPRQLRWHTRCPDCSGLELKTECFDASPVTDVTEKTFGTADTLALPAGRPAIDELLSGRVSLVQEEASAVGNKLILRGSVRASVVYLAADGRPASAELCAPFSAILELDRSEAAHSFETELALTGFLMEKDEGGVRLELGAVAQAVIRSRVQLCCITDAYSLEGALDTQYVTANLEQNAAATETADTLRLAVEGFRRPKAVVDIGVYCGKPRLEAGQYKAALTVKLLCIAEDDSLVTLSGKGEAVRPATSGSAGLTVAAGEPFASLTAGGVELRVPVVFSAPRWDTQSVRFLDQAEQTEVVAAEASAKPSVSLLRVSENDSIWSLGKQRSTACSVLRQLNDLPEGGEPAPGAWILLARQR